MTAIVADNTGGRATSLRKRCLAVGMAPFSYGGFIGQALF